MEPFSIKLELRIDWSELDLFGHVNNLSIQKYIQSAKINYLEKIGLMQSQSDIEIGPTLVSSTCQFRKMLFYPGNVTIYSNVDLIKTTSFRMHHKVMNDQNELIAEAHDIIVLFDFVKNHKHTIPDEIKRKITELENYTRP